MGKMNELTIEEIKEITGVITEEEFGELLENENVLESETLGSSGRFVSAVWYSFTLADGTEVDIYVDYN